MTINRAIKIETLWRGPLSESILLTIPLSTAREHPLPTPVTTISVPPTPLSSAVREHLSPTPVTAER